MAGKSLTQMARRKNIERMATRRRTEAERSEPPPPPPDIREESSPPALVEETAQTDMAEIEPVVNQEEGQVTEHRAEKHPAESEADYLENQVDKWSRMEESDLVVLFIIQPRIKNVPISFDASAVKDAAVALNLASSISLPVDRATFRAEPDLLSIALAAQSAILAAGRIAEIGHHQHNAIEQIGFLTAEVENEKGKAAEASLRVESEAIKAAEERARADAEANKAKSSDQLRLAAEERENAREEVLKLANETIAKLEVDLEDPKRAMANAESEISKSFQAGKDAALENYVEEVPKFENRGFKHSWLKALAATNVVSGQPIPYKQVDIKPLESDPE
ncbi:hypothetical protein CsSME_00032840 [Camellia sinensis var. sinensis]